MIHSPTRVSATEAARNLSELLNRVRYRGESFDVVRGGSVVARLTPSATPLRATAKELLEALRLVGAPDEAFAADLERVQAEQPTLLEDPWAT